MYQFSFPMFTGVPFTWAPPLIDGVVAGDLGWTNAFRYTVQNGTTVADVAVQGIHSGTALYLSFEINMDPTFDNDDVIVLAFDPGGGATNHRRIDIYPNTDNVEPPSAGNAPPREVDYWTNSGTWNTGAEAVINPTWLENNIMVSSGGTGNWNVEIRIPITTTASVDQTTDTGINIPLTGNFGFFFNVGKVDGGAGTVSQRSWPPGVLDTTADPIAEIDLDSSTPDPDTWGQASLSGTLSGGVYLTPSDITVTNGTGTGYTIDYTGPNIFNATIHNTSVDGNGNPLPVSGITAEFHIADFGITGPLIGDWTLVPVAGNPAGPQSIAASGQTLFSTGSAQPNTDWPATLQNDIKADTDQCILVELDSSEPGTLFLTKSTWQNMTVIDTNSPFQITPKIETKGIPLARGAQSYEITLNEFHYNTPNGSWGSVFNNDNLQKVKTGQYKLTIDPKQSTSVKLAATVTPPTIVIPRHVVNIAPADAQDTSISVQPGQVISLLAKGTVNLHPDLLTTPLLVGPAGINLADLPKLKAPVEEMKVADTSAAVTAHPTVPQLRFPDRPAGTLVGSFDDFKTTFLIGTGTTVKAPQGASNLSLAINGGMGVFDPTKAGGFNVQITQTTASTLNLSTSLVLREPEYEKFPLPIPYGANLPTYVLMGEVKTGQKLTIKGHKYDVVLDLIGCGVIIKKIGIRRLPIPRLPIKLPGQPTLPVKPLV